MNTQSSSGVFVVQPGNQVVGDQTFDSFSYSDTQEPLHEYTTSWKDPLQEAAPKTTAACVAVTIIGFILQFVSLRVMHSAVSVFQLGAILTMSFVRSMLRTQRLAREQNLLYNRPDQVPGHELDWLAMEIENSHKRVSKSSKAIQIYEIDPESPKPIKPSLNRTGSGGPTEGAAHQPEGSYVKRVESDKVCSDETVHICAITCSGPATISSQTEREIRIEHTNWIKERECAQNLEVPHCGARMFYYRARLAQLTSQSLASSKLSNAWGDDLVKARSQANMLKQAIEASVKVLLSDSRLQSDWRGARVLSWSFNADACAPGAEELPESSQIHLSLKRSPVPGNELSEWRAEHASLEAVIGLFAWAIISHPVYEEKDSFRNKVTIPGKWPFKRILAVSDSMQSLEKVDIELKFWTEDFPVVISRRSLAPLGSPGVSAKFRIELRRDRPAMLARQFFPLGLCVGTEGQALDKEPEYLKLFALAAYTNSRSPAVLCAHEVYLSFLVAATATVTSIGDKVTVSSGRDGLFLDNDLISKLVDCFASSHLGSRQDAYLIIVSALRSRGLLKVSRQTLLGVIKIAGSHQVAAEYDKAQEILQWVWDASAGTQGEIFESLVHEEQDVIMLAIGELYRLTMFSSTDFSKQGFQWMQDVKHNAKRPISRAARDIVDRYLELSRKNGELSQSNTRNSVPSSRAIMETISNNERVETPWLISQEGVHLLSSDSDGRTMLSWAAERGWIEVVKHTLQLGSNIDAGDKSGRTALSYAAANGHADVVTLLMNRNAVPSLEDSFGRSVLSYAAAAGSVTTIKALMSDRRATALTMDANGRSPLYYAAERGATDAVKYLLKSTVKMINERSTRDTPFIAAIAEGHHETAQVLVDYGAKWDMDIGGMRPWIWAVTNARWITAEFFLGHLNRREEEEEFAGSQKLKTTICLELRPHFAASANIFLEKAALVQRQSEEVAGQGGLVLRQFDAKGNEVALTPESAEMLLYGKLSVRYCVISGTRSDIKMSGSSALSEPNAFLTLGVLPLVTRELGDRFQITEKMLEVAASSEKDSLGGKRLQTLLRLGGDDVRLTDSVVECVVHDASCLLPFMDLLLEHKGSDVLGCESEAVGRQRPH
ncbi:hypothetical protein NLG97_g10206 [Lecanicillium saksenae]|uniref:Uncharacterized protein n=1 Tax=Lecanicillium saksenae TaxID=468837 RepID=A0ACC1QFN6_9HYPO|nr:hypothetical protein NLG97_g10206 [Lecanicillium saksenae]